MPEAGFACHKCFGETFLEHKKLYKRILFDLACPVPASPWPNFACLDTTAAQSAGVDTRAVQVASPVAGHAGANSLSVAPANAAAHDHVCELAGGADVRHGDDDDPITRVDTSGDFIVADASLRAEPALHRSETCGGVRTRARVRATAHVSGQSRDVRTSARARVDSHPATRPRLTRQFLSSSPVGARPHTRSQRHDPKPTLLRPLALAASFHDDSECLLDQAIRRAQLESQSFPYTVLTRSGAAALSMLRGYTKVLWVDRATRNPNWFATIVQLRALQSRIDALFVGAHQSPRPFRTTKFAGAAVLHTTSPPLDTFPPDTPLDVRNKKAWEVPVPTTYSHAVRGSHSPAWYASMQRELNSLMARNTWREGYIPPGVKAIATKWVYNVKSSLLFKSRLVARGDQRPRTNFEPDSDSPTLSRVSLNTLFAVGQTLGWKMHCLDVDCAYLYGDVPESVRGQVWLQVPQGMTPTLPPIAGRTIGLDLQHTLYGLRFSGRQWFLKLHNFLIANNYQPSSVDPCIYLRRTDTGFVAIAVYVDDLAIFSSDDQLLSDTKECLMNRFKMKDLGEISRYLGLEVERTDTTFTYHVAPYIAELVALYLPDIHPPVLSPADPGVKLSARACPAPESEEHQFMKNVPYDSLVGSLSYIAVAVRPDIARAVHTLQRAQAHPTRAHWYAALRILQYLRSTPTLGPKYSTLAGTQSQLQVHAYVDASFAPDWQDEDGVSVSGFIVYFAGGPIAWASHKQKHVAGSTCESEFIALSECLNTLEWIRHFLSELGIVQHKTKIFEDNQAAISIATSLSVSGNSRHVVVRYARVREAVKNETLEVIYVPTNQQYADTLTKVVSTPNFVKNLPFLLGQSTTDIRSSRQAYSKQYAQSLSP